MPLDPKVRALCEGLVRWWHKDDPERRMSMDGAHNLAGLVQIAVGLLAKDHYERFGSLPMGPSSSEED